MGKLLLNGYFWVAFGLITVIGLAVLPFLLLYHIYFCSRSIQAGLRRSITVYGWFLVCAVPFLSPVRVVYEQKSLPYPAIFVANHNSAIDPYLFGAIDVELGFVTSWPFKIPVYSVFMKMAGYVNAEDGWEQVLQKSRELLEERSSVTVWPEGHRSRDGRVGRFKNGAFALAVETGRPIVPVCIVGSGTVLPPGSKMFNRGRVTLYVLEPAWSVTEGLDREDINR